MGESGVRSLQEQASCSEGHHLLRDDRGKDSRSRRILPLMQTVCAVRMHSRARNEQKSMATRPNQRATASMAKHNEMKASLLVIQVLYVEPDDIVGNVVLVESCVDAQHIRLILVVPSALVVTQ